MIRSGLTTILWVCALGAWAQNPAAAQTSTTSATSVTAATPSAQTPYMRISGGVMVDRVLTKAPIKYPAEAKAKGVSGAVVLHALIGKDGHVEDVTAVSGPELLQQAAIDAVRQWTYEPYVLDGQAVGVDTLVTVAFNLEVAKPVAGPLENQVPPAPVRTAGNVFVSKLTRLVRPEYPAKAREQQISGTVVLLAVITKEGKVDRIRPGSAAPDVLIQAAVEAFRQWTFSPFEVNGQPVEISITNKVTFNPDGSTSTELSQTGAPIGAAKISAGVMVGMNLKRVQPEYPPAARAAHVSGTVVLHAIIGKDGFVKDLKVISGPPMLQDAAVNAVRQWAYKPFLLNGQPTEVDTTIQVNFALSTSSPQQSPSGSGPPNFGAQRPY